MTKRLDLVGKKFGKLTVIKDLGNINYGSAKHKLSYWLCRCDCGNKHKVIGTSLTSVGTKSCGCAKADEGRRRIIDLTGKKYNRLAVVNFSHRSKGRAWWNCICDCGNKCVVAGNQLRRGSIGSCGCFRRDKITERRRLKLIGKTFNYWTVIGDGGKKDHGDSLWLCKCRCGTERMVVGGALMRNGSKSCGCYSIEEVSERRRAKLTGKKFDRLTVIRGAGNAKSGGSLWECVCSCGNRKIATAGRLLSGVTRSCGCIFKEMCGENHPNWKGGISCEPYCDAWADKEYKEDMKERDN